MSSALPHPAERQRLENQRRGVENWRLWGPYLAERAWGSVREDYSAAGDAWQHFPHDHAHLRAYRWGEDGLAGLCDEQQRLCFALSLWNERDPILKERAFGLSGQQGNHGEDVKDIYFYLEATPSHSWLRYLYKYPQRCFPYAQLFEENARRGRTEPPFSLLDAGAFAEDRYWDIDVLYAKAGPAEIHVRIVCSNRGPERATLHVLPKLWFRNTWSWSAAPTDRPSIVVETPAADAQWAVRADHPSLGTYRLYGRHRARLMFTENETNNSLLWGEPNASPYVKDAFHRRVVGGEIAAVNPELRGTQFAAWHMLEVDSGHGAMVGLTLSDMPLASAFARREAILAARRSECDVFYDELLPNASAEDHVILKQALSGMIWNKQFFCYDVARWLDGDRHPPPAIRRRGRNRQWRHFNAADVLSMPDKWEYPWFAAWDLAFHCAALALVDVDFAKAQIELLLSERFLHPNGQIPAYEWAFGDVNPPVHAQGALKAFRAERVQRGDADVAFLERVLHKLLMNYAWWLNRKDIEGHSIFEGGFMGLDNISVYNRSEPLPYGYALKQADATGWMAMFALNMTVMALEICVAKPEYENVAIQCYLQFMAIADAIAGRRGEIPGLWDDDDGFFKDLVVTSDGAYHHVDVFSWVGLIPLFATEVIDERLLAGVPRFRATLEAHYRGIYDGRKVTHCPIQTNEQGAHLLALVNPRQLKRILRRVLDEREFLSPHGVRSLSRLHAERSDLGVLPGVGQALIEYVPGESNSGMFGGNSNWRGPVWMPTNFLLVQAIEKFHRYYGDAFKIDAPAAGNERITLREAANVIADRLVSLYRRAPDGRIPAYPPESPLQRDPHWRDLHLFFEYFHGETGQGLGAMHQTGWTGLIANLLFRRYRREIPAYWREPQRQFAAQG